MDPWDDSWRTYPAALAIAFGLLLSVRGAALAVGGLRLPVETPGKNLVYIRGFRLLLFGASLAVAGAGWLWQIPALVAAGLVIGFEETLETTIVASALRQEY